MAVVVHVWVTPWAAVSGVWEGIWQGTAKVSTVCLRVIINYPDDGGSSTLMKLASDV